MSHATTTGLVPRTLCYMLKLNSHGRNLTIQGILVLNERLLTLRVWRLVGLCQSAPGALGHLSLVEGLGKPYHWHVLPLTLASVVLLQTRKRMG